MLLHNQFDRLEAFLALFIVPLAYTYQTVPVLRKKLFPHALVELTNVFEVRRSGRYILDWQTMLRFGFLFYSDTDDACPLQLSSLSAFLRTIACRSAGERGRSARKRLSSDRHRLPWKK